MLDLEDIREIRTIVKEEINIATIVLAWIFGGACAAVFLVALILSGIIGG